MMGFVVGILSLPLFLWSWLVGKNEEDGDLALSLIACLVFIAVTAWVTLWALGLQPWP